MIEVDNSCSANWTLFSLGVFPMHPINAQEASITKISTRRWRYPAGIIGRVMR
jgi:hypothetical protein